MRCELQRRGNQIVCARCERPMHLPAAAASTPLDRVHRACTVPETCSAGKKPPSDACTHRGGVAREIGCQSCGGELKLPIYHCDVHGECTLRNYASINEAFASVKVCLGCPEQKPVEPELPGLAAKALHLAKDVAVDLAAGRARRSPERIAEIFNSHCRPCPLYNSAAGACSACGCPVSPTEPEWNRIAIAALGCSAEVPKWLPEAPASREAS